MKNLCEGCDGRCCSEYAVTVSDVDIARIVDGRGLDPSSFLGFLPGDDLDSSYPDVRIGGEYFYLILKRDGDRTCCFVREGDGGTCCGIHGFHPINCGIYPFMRSGADGIKLRPKPKCEEGWVFSAADEKRILKDLITQERERDEFKEKVVGWNQGKREDYSLEGFLDYISKI